MSRSFKKAFVTISKKWDTYKEHRFRRRVKKELQKVEKEIAFDPDADFEALVDRREMGSWGTKFGLEFGEDVEDDYWKEDRVRMKRK